MWALLDDNFPSHPKTIQAGPLAAYLFVCGLCYCRKYHTDGFIPSKAVLTMASMPTPRRLIDALLMAGFWEAVKGGFQVHGYRETYPDDPGDKEKQEERRRQKQDAGRKGGLASWRRRSAEVPASDSAEAEMKQPASNAAEAHRAEAYRVGTGSGTGLGSVEKKKREAEFSEFWASYPRKDGKQAARSEWHKIKPDNEIQQDIAADVQRRSGSAQWQKDGGEFIPHARTYLHQRRWEDEFEPTLVGKPGAIPVYQGLECPHMEPCTDGTAACKKRVQMPWKYPLKEDS